MTTVVPDPIVIGLHPHLYSTAPTHHCERSEATRSDPNNRPFSH